MRFTRFSATLREITLACLTSSLLAQPVATAADSLTLELTPRVCTLSADDEACTATITASWQSPRPLSLCLSVVNRPQAAHCWEEASEGVYELELRTAGDMTFELRDRDRGRLLASALLRVVRETNRYRRKRREPWNVFD